MVQLFGMKKDAAFLKGATLQGKEGVHRVRPLNPLLSTQIGALQSRLWRAQRVQNAVKTLQMKMETVAAALSNLLRSLSTRTNCEKDDDILAAYVLHSSACVLPSDTVAQASVTDDEDDAIEINNCCFLDADNDDKTFLLSLSCK